MEQIYGIELIVKFMSYSNVHSYVDTGRNEFLKVILYLDFYSSYMICCPEGILIISFSYFYIVSLCDIWVSFMRIVTFTEQLLKLFTYTSLSGKERVVKKFLLYEVRFQSI